MIEWTSQAELWGVEVKAFFFDAQQINPLDDIRRRLLPFLDPNNLTLLSTEKSFFYKDMVASPDAVFQFGGGYITLEYKSKSKRDIFSSMWQRQIRLKDMLQCIVAGFVLAQSQRTLTACVLRYHNAAFFLNPCCELIAIICEQVHPAKQYFETTDLIKSSDLADFVSKKVDRRFGNPFMGDQRQAGYLAHEEMLRKN